MSIIVTLAIVCFSYFGFSKSDCDLNLFKENNIVPGIIPAVPKQPLMVKISEKTIACGEELSTLDSLALDQPEINYNGDANSFYTLIMLDPHRYILTVWKQDEPVEDYSYLGIRTNFVLEQAIQDLKLSEVSFGHYFNVTSKPDALVSSAVGKI